MSLTFDPQNANLTALDQATVVCYLNASSNDYDGRLGARISAIFVILIISSLATLFPVVAAKEKCVKIPLWAYLFARYFGAGVIIATAFIHLLDPAYREIGPASCVGVTGNWSSYSWPPAIMLCSIFVIFLLDFGAEQYVDRKYGFAHAAHLSVEHIVTSPPETTLPTHNQLHSGDQDPSFHAQIASNQPTKEHQRLETKEAKAVSSASSHASEDTLPSKAEQAFRQQIAAFLILEFGVIFHSVIIGLNLGSVGAEFSTLYPVLVFHQSFEGLGIGARMSAIPFPQRLSWLPWALCAGYGLTTPVSIAIGLAIRTTYNSGSFTASVVSGVLDATSAGILCYTGLVELLARDFLFNAELTREKGRLVFMVGCVIVGAGVMALLGKWA